MKMKNTPQKLSRTNSTVDLNDLRKLKSRLALQGMSFSKWLRQKIREEVSKNGR